MMMSGKSTITALAAAFISSRARRSFGFSKAYLEENLVKINLIYSKISWANALMETAPVDTNNYPSVW